MPSNTLLSRNVGLNLLWSIRMLFVVFLLVSVRRVVDIALIDGRSSTFFSSMAYLAILAALMLAVTVFTVIWIYKVHKDLEHLSHDYPIKPHDSLKMALIPVYNFWGTWKMTSVVSAFFKTRNHPLKWGTYSLETLFFIAAALVGANQILMRIMGLEVFSLYSSTTLAIYQSLLVIFNLLSFSVLYFMVALVNNGVAWLEKESKQLPQR